MHGSRFQLAELYEAVVDDEHFAALPGRLARFFGARSAVIHWLHGQGRSTVDAHCDYFTPAQFQLYADTYAQYDVWTKAALGPNRRNRAWNTSDLISKQDLEASIFYNDWIRQMGDDTYNCIGAVMETEHGLGIIGLHRGRAQGDFDEGNVRKLDRSVLHLRRAITIRAALVERQRTIDGWEQIFSRSAVPTLIIDRLGRLRRANAAAEALLSGERRLAAKGHAVLPCNGDQAAAFRDLLARATDPALPEACQGAFGRSPLDLWIAEFLPLVSGHLAGCAMVTITDRGLGSGRGNIPDLLRRLYALTRAEAEVASALADGQAIEDIAARRGSAPETVRAQVKQVLAKTGTRRQSEIVALVLRLSLE